MQFKCFTALYLCSLCATHLGSACLPVPTNICQFSYLSLVQYWCLLRSILCEVMIGDALFVTDVQSYTLLLPCELWPLAFYFRLFVCMCVYECMADREQWVITLSINGFICHPCEGAFLGVESTLLWGGAQINTVIRSLTGEQCAVRIMRRNDRVKPLNTQSIRLLPETERETDYGLQWHFCLQPGRVSTTQWKSISPL